MPKTILITGATDGIGLLTAKTSPQQVMRSCFMGGTPASLKRPPRKSADRRNLCRRPVATARYGRVCRGSFEKARAA